MIGGAAIVRPSSLHMGTAAWAVALKSRVKSAVTSALRMAPILLLSFGWVDVRRKKAKGSRAAPRNPLNPLNPLNPRTGTRVRPYPARN